MMWSAEMSDQERVSIWVGPGKGTCKERMRDVVNEIPDRRYAITKRLGLIANRRLFLSKFEFALFDLAITLRSPCNILGILREGLHQLARSNLASRHSAP